MNGIKARTKNLVRPKMAKLSPEARRRSFDEVALGLTEEQAVAEAERCIQCARPTCNAGCPANIDIPRFILAIRERRFQDAIEIIREENNLPAITGRVCPQEVQCERACVLSKLKAPIAIGALERFAADYEMKAGRAVHLPSKRTGKKIAVVGSGPAGLTVAGDLARLGHKVTIFEALHTVGGVLTYGIPDFRLPKHILKWEVEYIKSLGVKIQTNIVVGKTITIDEIFNMGFDAVFIGTGAGSPKFLGIPGENLSGIYSANEFLSRVVLMRAFKFPTYDTPIRVGKRVVVIGGGNTAMDAARVALRLGPNSVTIVYRRSEEEMPARLEEVENAKEEGVEFLTLTSPVRFIGNEKGWIEKVECVKMALTEPDSSGRRRPVPIEGSNFYLDADTVIVAIGQGPNPILAKTTPDLKVDREGYLIVDENYRTSKERVWAGGDAVPNHETVIEAVGSGKKAAKDIHRYLMSDGPQPWSVEKIEQGSSVKMAG